MKPADKHPGIRKFQNDILDTNVEENIEMDICSSCGQAAVNFKNDISRREFAISGLCQACQDEVFDSFDDEQEEDFDDEKGKY